MLNFMLNTETATRPTAWFVALHDGDPGETGATDEIVVGTDTDYVRQSVVFGPASAGQCLNITAATSWTAASSITDYTISHVSIWSAATGGTCYFKGALLATVDMTNDSVFTISVGDLAVQLD